MKRLFMVFALIFMLTGCKTEEAHDDVVITYETNGGVSISEVNVEYDSFYFLETPSRDGYTFGGWFTDEAFTSEVHAYQKRTEDITVYAGWNQIIVNITDEDDIDTSSLPYSDYLNDTNPVIIIIVRGIGTMELELFPSVAPNTVDNLISYILQEDYDSNTFHRIIEDFMIQGGMTESDQCSITGDFSSNGVENNLSHYRGVISMARTSVNDSATSQFFVVHEDSTFLDGSYATFGGLISGFNVLDYIAGVDTISDVPITSIDISSITIDLNGYEPNTPNCAN